MKRTMVGTTATHPGSTTPRLSRSKSSRQLETALSSAKPETRRPTTNNSSPYNYDYLAIGPDATNLEYDTVWTSVGLEFNTDTPNEAGQIVKGIRVKGLGVANIDFTSAKKYSLPSSREAGFPSIDLDPKGAVIISLRQTNVKGTYLEQLQNNNQSWINVLENGLADDGFSAKREFALTAIGSGHGLPPRPHNTFLTTGSPMVAIDKSNQHSGRIYVVYTNRPGIYSNTTRPYLIWSDDRGLTGAIPSTCLRINQPLQSSSLQ
jgi:hypothetical protein